MITKINEFKQFLITELLDPTNLRTLRNLGLIQQFTSAGTLGNLLFANNNIEFDAADESLETGSLTYTIYYKDKKDIAFDFMWNDIDIRSIEDILAECERVKNEILSNETIINNMEPSDDSVNGGHEAGNSQTFVATIEDIIADKDIVLNFNIMPFGF